MQRDIKGVHIVSSEICRFLEGGLATLGFIFSVILNVKNLSAHLLANKVVAAVFPQNHNFFGTPCIIGTWQPPVKLLIPE